MTTVENIQEEYPKRWRILVVDNDPQQRADHVANLIGWGYEVYLAEVAFDAEDAYDALAQDAIQKANNHRCQLAVVDQRLRSDGDFTDFSGLSLSHQIDVRGGIILSGYLPPNSSEHSASDAWIRVGKQEGPEVLKRAVEILIARFASEDANPGSLRVS